MPVGSWHTCRQKKQLAKARAGDMGTSAEGEKLHSDSGVFLDTHSLQEPHQPGKGEHPAPRGGGWGGGHPWWGGSWVWGGVVPWCHQDAVTASVLREQLYLEEHLDGVQVL